MSAAAEDSPVRSLPAATPGGAASQPPPPAPEGAASRLWPPAPEGAPSQLPLPQPGGAASPSRLPPAAGRPLRPVALPQPTAAGADEQARLELAPAGGRAEVYRQLGQITRQLHDALHRLGVMPRLQQSAQDLPDVRSRLQYVVRKTGAAAERTLAAVERAKSERSRLDAAALRLAGALGVADAVDAVGAVHEVAAADLPAAAAAAPGARAATPGSSAAAHAVALRELRAAGRRIDAELTEILLAQDFHDLTGQVVAQVVALAIELEDSLVELLLRAAPAEPIPPSLRRLGGPVVDAAARADVARNQQEVDELLAGLGF